MKTEPTICTYSTATELANVQAWYYQVLPKLGSEHMHRGATHTGTNASEYSIVLQSWTEASCDQMQPRGGTPQVRLGVCKNAQRRAVHSNKRRQSIIMAINRTDQWTAKHLSVAHTKAVKTNGLISQLGLHGEFSTAQCWEKEMSHKKILFTCGLKQERSNNSLFRDIYLVGKPTKQTKERLTRNSSEWTPPGRTQWGTRMGAGRVLVMICFGSWPLGAGCFLTLRDLLYPLFVSPNIHVFKSQLYQF